eukprot:5844721-Amphidinium_carterae.1
MSSYQALRTSRRGADCCMLPYLTCVANHSSTSSERSPNDLTQSSIQDLRETEDQNLWSTCTRTAVVIPDLGQNAGDLSL